ncbi:late embryogenesis abundant protein [Musa troglodytarum]|uniref:Late embryogenesis abundant protein n=2 Tax=Musa troglodytarum TaxID=320322 RepID=A0A9E7E7G5_9LILI|nr:late embryogenesis abundant protein [Musa troglodytarum]
MSSLIDKAKEFVAEKIAQTPKPEASLASVSIRSFTRDSVLFHSEVAVLNPYSHSIPICQLSYALKSAGREVASGTMPDPGSLPASAETKLEVSVKVPYDFLISLMRDIGRDRDIDDEMQVGLTIDLPIIGDFTIPLSTKGEIKLPTLSDLLCGGGGGGDEGSNQ